MTRTWSQYGKTQDSHEPPTDSFPCSHLVFAAARRPDGLRQVNRAPHRPDQAGDPGQPGSQPARPKSCLLAGGSTGGGPEAGQGHGRRLRPCGCQERACGGAVEKPRHCREVGYLDAEGMAEMRKGEAPIIRRGPYNGDQLSVDHIIPRAVCPELDSVIANLESMPLRMNESRNDKVGARQTDLARKSNEAGLLSDEGLKAVENVAR
jgi:hypothetical protein